MNDIKKKHLALGCFNHRWIRYWLRGICPLNFLVENPKMSLQFEKLKIKFHLIRIEL